jgi:hypothetical protein
MPVVQSQLVTDALQETEVYLYGIPDVYLVGQEIPCFYETLKIIAVFTRNFHWIISVPFRIKNPSQFTIK